MLVNRFSDGPAVAEEPLNLKDEKTTCMPHFRAFTQSPASSSAATR